MEILNCRKINIRRTDESMKRVEIATYRTNNHVTKALVQPTQGNVFFKENQMIERKYGFIKTGITFSGFKNRQYNGLEQKFGYGLRVCS